MPGQIVRSELGIELPLLSLGYERPFIPVLLCELDACFTILGQQNLARCKPRQHCCCIARSRDHEPELSSREIGGSYSNYIARWIDSAEIIVSSFVEHVVRERCTRRDRLDDLPPDNALGLLRVFRLLTD